MSYTVKTEVFEGPLDLLLHLVGRQRVDVSAIRVSDVADQYLEHIERMRELDLDVASEFLLLAATLLEIKAAALVPSPEPFVGDELDDLSPEEARELLVERLLVYRQFKSVAAELAQRMENEGRQHPRQAGLEPGFLGLMPDFLHDVTAHTLAVICAELVHRREVFLLEAEHIASRPLSLEARAAALRELVGRHGRITFSELIGADATVDVVVVSLLAVLELYKRGEVDISQTTEFGEIVIARSVPAADPDDGAKGRGATDV